MQEPTSEELIIEASDLERRFGDTVAVDGLDLQVRRGEILGLVGPDGAGKTTTLRLLTGLVKPTVGSVRVFDHDAMRHPGRIHGRLGYMAQRFTLYADLTVQENLRFYGDVRGVRGKERAERNERLLGFAGLTEFRERLAGQLSGGMQKKLALACALIHEPDLLLLDEPTTGVDPVSRREFWDMLSELHSQGVTMVVSTPYMDEAERCSRVGLMFQGRLLACDTPVEIKGSVSWELLVVWPESLFEARHALEDMEWIEEVQPYGDQVRVLVKDADAALPRIQEAFDEASIEIRDIRPAPIRMEEAFVSLIQRQYGSQDTSAPQMMRDNHGDRHIEPDGEG